MPEGHPILDAPHWLLTGLAGGRLQFIETTRDLLRAASFLDGRTPLSNSGRTSEVELAAARTWIETARSPRPLWIAHTAFCGSTLLSRLIEATARCLVYREPVAFNEVSSRRPPMGQGPEAPLWSTLLKLTIAQFQKQFAIDEPAVVKLSNWPADLIPDLCLMHGEARAVFVTMTPDAFLATVLQGGPERVKYMIRFSNHLARHIPELSVLNDRIDADTQVSVAQRGLRRCLVTLRAQQSLLDSVYSRMPPDRALWLTFDEVQKTPVECASRARATLGLPATSEGEHDAISAVMARHAKSPDLGFNAASAAQARAAVVQRFGAELDHALQWGAELRD